MWKVFPARENLGVSSAPIWNELAMCPYFLRITFVDTLFVFQCRRVVVRGWEARLAFLTVRAFTDVPEGPTPWYLSVAVAAVAVGLVAAAAVQAVATVGEVGQEIPVCVQQVGLQFTPPNLLSICLFVTLLLLCFQKTGCVAPKDFRPAFKS